MVKDLRLYKDTDIAITSVMATKTHSDNVGNSRLEVFTTPLILWNHIGVEIVIELIIMAKYGKIANTLSFIIPKWPPNIARLPIKRENKNRRPQIFHLIAKGDNVSLIIKSSGDNGQRLIIAALKRNGITKNNKSFAKNFS